MFGSEEHAFHGMGREDIDVRCLGRGRPLLGNEKPVRNIDSKVILDVNA